MLYLRLEEGKHSRDPHYWHLYYQLCTGNIEESIIQLETRRSRHNLREDYVLDLDEVEIPRG